MIFFFLFDFFIKARALSTIILKKKAIKKCLQIIFADIFFKLGSNTTLIWRWIFITDLEKLQMGQAVFQMKILPHLK